MGAFAFLKNMFKFFKEIAAKVREFVSTVFGGRTPPTEEEGQEREEDVEPEVPVQEPDAYKPRRRLIWQFVGTVALVGAVTVAKALTVKKKS